MSSKRTGYLHDERGFVRVKNGFSWPAFLFGSLWAFVKGLWGPAVAMFVLDAAFWFASGYTGARRLAGPMLVASGLQAMYFVLRGWWGNRWRRAQLLRQGYRALESRRTPTPSRH